jgi:Domain of unknown function (DUF1905)
MASNSSSDGALRSGDAVTAGTLELEFHGEVVYWRGPAPFYFVPVPEGPSVALRAISSDVSYGWGVIPVRARIGRTVWRTSLFPKDGRYLVPIKDAVRLAEDLDTGDIVTVWMVVGS